MRMSTTGQCFYGLIVFASMFLAGSVGAGTECITDQPGCEGLAKFANTSASEHECCTVFWGEGSQGNTNFCMEPEGTHELHVRVGDRYCCVQANERPSADCAREPIRVPGPQG